jgi:hypothetical protein
MKRLLPKRPRLELPGEAYESSVEKCLKENVDGAKPVVL